MLFDYIADHQAEFWLVLGFVLLAVEVATGFVSGIFLFAGIGALCCGGLMTLEVLPETWVAGLAGTGVSTGVITGLLWKPFKKLQGDKAIEKDNSSDLVGYQFVLTTSLTTASAASTEYSGVTWKVTIDPKAQVDKIEANQLVEVTSVEVAKFLVKPA
ncbi:NfeD family protein [Aliikangiella sp. IMCC44632]